MGLSLTIKGNKDLRKVSESLRRASGTLRSELTKAFRTAGESTLRRVKQNIETMHIVGFRTGRDPPFTAKLKGSNIRRRISRITELKISTSAADPRVRFEVKNEQLADIHAQRVPWHLDRGGIFRHPIVGNRRSWAGSMGKPWFYDEIKSDRAVFEAECDKAIDRTIQKIEGG